jgi:peptidoglycan/LPS O-acetylase OafA/YrhL
MTKAAEEKSQEPIATAPPAQDEPTVPVVAGAGDEPPKKRLPRVESLTGLRWWAAFFVFTHHMTSLAPLPIAKFLGLGISGVTFFFVLSGFVLTWSARPGTKVTTFYRRRFARIWPAHMVALLASIFVFYRVHPDPTMTWIKPLSIGVLLLSVVLLHGWSNNPAIIWGGNPASWTLSVEAFFYAYFPFVWRATAKLKEVGGAVMCAVVALAGLLYYPALYRWPDVVPTLPQPVLHSVSFLFGIGLAIMLRSGWRPRVPVWATFVLTGLALYTLYKTGLHPRQYPFGVTLALTQRVSLAVVYGILIFAVASRDMRGGRSLLRSRPMVALGKWSYSFYLIHATLIYAIREQTGAHAVSWSNLTWYAGLLALSIFASWLLYKFVEHPLEKRLRGPR